MSSLTGGPEGNIRKESKMYSVQDQRWDAEMRAEMIKKKVDELKDKGVRELLKLTEVSRKLRDSVSARLELEEEIRVKMKKVSHSSGPRPLFHPLLLTAAGASRCSVVHILSACPHG